MKIMHLISGGDVGGAKTHVLSLLQELSRHHEVELVCFVEGLFAEEARQMGINTRVLKKRGLLKICRELKKYLKNKQFDLLHCHGSKANVASVLMGGNMSVPVISTVHSDPRLDYLGRPLANMTIGLLNRFALRRRDGWVAVSDSMKELLMGRGYDGDRILPIYNGIGFPKKMPCKPRQEYLRDMGLDWNEDNVIFGIAARISAVKDMTTLVKAFALAVKEAPNARLLIAGDGEQRPEIEALAKGLCPAGTVHFAGWQSDMNSFYHALDVNMLTSISETFPYAITEGARMYCATISTAVGGVPRVVIDGQTGFLIDVGDYETMSRRMVQVALDARLRSQLGRAIYDKVRAEFSVEAMGKRQAEIYESILARRARQQRGRYGIMICGAYGKGNAGDDSILVSMIRQLRAQDPEVPICVMTRRPKETAIMTGVSTVHIFNVFQVGRRLKDCNLYISGGGSLIQNITSTRSLLYYLFSIRQAKRAGCKVMMYGCGIGPVDGEQNQRAAAKVLQNNVDLIALRDRESAQTLASFGVDRPEIRVTADPALLMEGDTSAAERYMERNGLRAQGKYCMFVLRPWADTVQRLDAICAAADYAWEKYGMMPLFYTLEPERDEEITQAAASLVKAPCKVLPPIANGAQLCGLIGKMELVVSMRLHALIFACSQQTRVAGISYDPKVSGFMEYLGSENCVELGNVTRERMRELLDRAMTSGYQVEQVNHLKALAVENGILAGQLLGETE